MSILYGLGLDGMLGPSQHPPLTDAMLTSILDDDGSEHEVLQSVVVVDISNDRGESVSLRRKVTGSNKERQLIRVSQLNTDKSENNADKRDLLVRTKHAASHEDGFHFYLSRFVGFEEPLTGSEATGGIPLYWECIFPYFFIDQISGWRDIKSRMPTYLDIPQMAKRATEYVLNLDVLARALRRRRLQDQTEALRSRWVEACEIADNSLRAEGMKYSNLSRSPPKTWPPKKGIQVVASDGDDWREAAELRDELQDRLDVLINEELPASEELSTHMLSQLRAAEERLFKLDRRLQNSLESRIAEEAQLKAVDDRVDALREDLRRYEDAKRIADRAGDLRLSIDAGVCPTCHQDIRDALLDPTHQSNPMSLEENVRFIRDQISIFTAMRTDVEEAVDATQRKERAARKRVIEVSEYIRSIKATLRSDVKSVSVATVREQLTIESRIASLSRALDGASDVEGDLESLYSEWHAIELELRSLAADGLSDDDQVKLDHLQQSIKKQLAQYGFKSFGIEHVEVSPDSYRVVRDGYEIGVTSVTSASDYIRMIWAYTVGLLEVARRQATNHIGLVVLDEPKQQSASKVSFDALLRRAATSRKHGQQVIFATSEEEELLMPTVEKLDCNLVRFDGRMLSKTVKKTKK